MKKKSLANPESYKNKTKIYDKFSLAEDYEGKIDKFLIPKIKNKIVLDFGCGSGRYAKPLAPHSKKYFAIDVTKEKLSLAKKKIKNKIYKINSRKNPFTR